jgi:hypothetical protein
LNSLQDGTSGIETAQTTKGVNRAKGGSKTQFLNYKLQGNGVEAGNGEKFLVKNFYSRKIGI